MYTVLRLHSLCREITLHESRHDTHSNKARGKNQKGHEMQQSPARSVRYPRAAPFPRPPAVPQARLRLYSRACLLAPHRCRFHTPRLDPPIMPATQIPARLVEDEAPSIAVHLLPPPSTALHLLLTPLALGTRGAGACRARRRGSSSSRRRGRPLRGGCDAAGGACRPCAPKDRARDVSTR